MALETKVDIILESQKTMTTKLDMMIPTLVTQSQLSEKTTVLNAEIASLKLELLNARKRSALQSWLTGTLSAAFGVVMTILIQSYLAG